MHFTHLAVSLLLIYTTLAARGTDSEEDAGEELIANGQRAAIQDYPWQAGIYRELPGVNNYTQDCGGSLVSTQYVVTAAHCVWNTKIQKVQRKEILKIVLGKFHRDWQIRDPGEQRCDIEEIIVQRQYRGSRGNYQYDIAIVRLQTDVQLTTFIKPVSIDWLNQFEKDQLVTNMIGTLVGWGFTLNKMYSPELQFVKLPYVSNEDCADSLGSLQYLLSGDKFCAGFIGTNTSACPGDSGGGLVFYHRATDNHYLRGVLSIAFRPAHCKDKCYTQHPTGFTSVSDPLTLQWLTRNINIKIAPTVRPTSPDRKDEPFQPTPPNRKDELVRPTPPNRKDEPVQPTSPNRNEQDDNTGCGKKGLSASGQISRENEVLVGEYPWLAGFYVQTADSSYTYKCGGTLVTPGMVITAAHCMYDHQTRRKIPHNRSKVALGKVLRSWDEHEDGEQKVDVKNVLFHLQYETFILIHDIAVVLLATPVTLSPTVNIVCFDWRQNVLKPLESGNYGMVASYNLMLNGHQQDYLQSVTLPWVSVGACFAAIPESRRRYYTFDKLCAGYLNQSTSVCPEDSGAGLVFKDETTQRFYLRGVVSISFDPATKVRNCYSQLYSGFTSLSVYTTWLRLVRDDALSNT